MFLLIFPINKFTIPLYHKFTIINSYVFIIIIINLIFILDCRQKLWGSLDNLFKIYHIVISGEGNFKVSSDDAIHFVEALR